MLLLHKGGLNHLWKALKIIKVLKCWDLSDLSIPDKKSTNPQILHSKLRRLPCKPRWESLKGKYGSKTQPLAVLFKFWPVSWEKGACMTTWCAYLHLSLTPTLSSYFWALQQLQLPVTSSTDRAAVQGAELVSVMGETTSKLETCHILRTRKTWVHLSLGVYLIRPKKSNHKIQVSWKICFLISQLAGWESPYGRSLA